MQDVQAAQAGRTGRLGQQVRGRVRRYAATVVVAGAALAVGGVGSALAADASGSVQAPPDDTIVSITGDKANGFGIEFYDGSALFPPTDSEARAECSEYDTRVARVRCRVEVRTWYRDLTDFKVALDWAHAS